MGRGEYSRHKGQDYSACDMYKHRIFRKGNAPELAVTLRWIEKYSKGMILKIWELASLFISSVSFLPHSPLSPLFVSATLLSCRVIGFCHVTLVITHADHELIEASGSHLLETTGVSSAVIKLTCSCYSSISNHSRKTEFPLLNTGRITLGSTDDLSKDFPPTAKWWMACPCAHKTNV